MMKTVFTFLSLMLIASLGFAQNGPITFEPGEEGADWTWEVFENDTNPDLQIIPNPDTMGANTSATVAQFTALQTGAPFAGCQSEQTVDLGTFEWDSTNRTVKIMVWKSEISDVGIKFDTETGWSEGEIKVSNTVVNEWEELTFDFSNAQNPPPGNGQLSRIVIFPDFNLDGRSQDNIVYFDNVRFEEASAEPDEVVVEVDAAATFTGFANVFETPANGGGFAFGSPWGVPDIKSVIDTAGNSVTLFPNFNTYADNPDDPFWVDQTTGLGNKVFEGNTFVEDASLAGKTVTFEGEVESYTLSPDYETRVYIKVFNSDFSELKEVSEPLTEAGPFSITFDNPEAADAVVQYGFSVTGLNANPDDEAALGNVVILGEGGGPVTDPQVAAPDPTEAEENVLSLYSDIYTDVEVDTWLWPAGGADLEDIEIDGNPTKKYTNLSFFGVETKNDNLIDASDMDFFHIDLWTPNIDTLTITIIDWGSDGQINGGDDSEHELIFTDLPQGEWNSLELALEDFEGLTARSNLAQYIFTGSPGGEGTLFVDNVYFSKMPTSIVNSDPIDVRIYPNQTSDFVILDSQTPVTSCVLYTMSGQRVLEKVNPGNKLNVNRIGAGLYIIEIKTNEGVMRQRLIIQ